MMFGLFICESCTPVREPVELPLIPPIAAPAEPPPAPAVVPPGPLAPPPDPEPQAAFRAWVDAWLGVNSGAGVAHWGGRLPVASGETVAFEALVCTVGAPGATHEAKWLVEFADGRRWSIPGATDEVCRPANEQPAFAAGRAQDRLTLREGGATYFKTTSWTFDETGPYVYAESRHEPNFWRTVDAEGCVETSERRQDGKVVEHLVGRSAGCGGFGEIPIVEADHPTRPLTSELLRGVTDATFQVHAERDPNGFLVLVATIPRIDSPAPKGASVDRLRVSDHFEVWFDRHHSPFAVGFDDRGAASFAPLEAEGLAGSVVVSASRGEVRIATGRARYPKYDDPLPATVIFVDGDGHEELGAVSSGPLLDGLPHPFNRVASSAWRFKRVEVNPQRDEDVRQAPAARYRPGL